MMATLVPFFQRQDALLVLQQHDGLFAGLRRQGVVLIHVEGLALQRLDGVGDGQDHVQQLVHPPVQQLLAEPAGLHGVDQLQVGVAPGGGHLQMGARPDALHMVVGAAPVGHHEALEAPLVPEDLLQEMLVLVGVGPVDAVIGGHDGLGLALLDSDLEAGQIDLPQSALVHDGVGGHAAQLLGVGGEVLGAGGHTIGLDASDVAGGHLACQVGVLGEILEVAPTERRTLDVQSRAEHHAHPLGGGFLAQAPADLFAQDGVPGVGDGGCRGEAGGGKRGVQTELIAFPGLLADAMGAVGQGHVRHAQPHYAPRLPEVLSGEEIAFLLQGHLLDDVRVFQI